MIPANETRNVGINYRHLELSVLPSDVDGNDDSLVGFINLTWAKFEFFLFRNFFWIEVLELFNLVQALDVHSEPMFATNSFGTTRVQYRLVFSLCEEDCVTWFNVTVEHISG